MDISPCLKAWTYVLLVLLAWPRIALSQGLLGFAKLPYIAYIAYGLAWAFALPCRNYPFGHLSEVGPEDQSGELHPLC